jgi:hypothetical protein
MLVALLAGALLSAVLAAAAPAGAHSTFSRWQPTVRRSSSLDTRLARAFSPTEPLAPPTTRRAPGTVRPSRLAQSHWPGHANAGVAWPAKGSALSAIPALGPPEELSAPVVLGKAVEGETLRVQHGGWTGSPSSYEDEWFSCNAEAKDCLEVEIGESYRVRSSDVGRRIGVIEWASNAAGEGGPAFSELSSVVTSAPPQTTSTQGPPPPPPAPAPAPAPVGAIGVLASNTVAVSAAQLKTLLGSLLVPTGRNAKTRELLAHGGYSLSFTALSAGQLTISWYLVPRGAHLAGAKPVLVARGEVSSASEGATELTTKLTSMGRALLRHRNRIKLTAIGTITSPGVSPVTASASFSLRR